MLDHLFTKTKHMAGTAGIGLAATIALSIGLGFWTLAAWLFLLSQTSALTAAMILGGFYTGAGFIGFTVVSLRGKQQVQQPATPTVDGLVGAFMTGVKAGAGTRQTSR